MSWTRRGLLVSILPVALLSGCSPVHGYRYKLVVEVEVDGRLVKVEGVRRCWTQTRSAFPNGSLVHSYHQGDAIAVDLGSGRVLFVLMAGYAYKDVPQASSPLLPWAPTRHIFPQGGDGPPELPFVGNVFTLRGRPVSIPFDDMPAFVTFDHRANKTTGRLVNPSDLAAAFGPGVHLKRVVAATVNAPITRGIEKWLPWLAEMKRNRMLASTTSFTPGQFTPNVPYFSS